MGSRDALDFLISPTLVRAKRSISPPRAAVLSHGTGFLYTWRLSGRYPPTTPPELLRDVFKTLAAFRALVLLSRSPQLSLGKEVRPLCDTNSIRLIKR